MATNEKIRSSYFTPLELEVLIRTYGEYEHFLENNKTKPNTAAELCKAFPRVIRTFINVLLFLCAVKIIVLLSFVLAK